MANGGPTGVCPISDKGITRDTSRISEENIPGTEETKRGNQEGRWETKRDAVIYLSIVWETKRDAVIYLSIVGNQEGKPRGTLLSIYLLEETKRDAVIYLSRKPRGTLLSIYLLCELEK